MLQAATDNTFVTLELAYSSILLLIILMIPMTAQHGDGGGMPRIGGAPTVIGAGYTYFDSAELNQFMGHYSKTADLGMIPGAAPGSKLSSLILSGGGRFGNVDDSLRVRWRAALVDSDLGRGWITFGITGLDFDRSGTMHRDYRWVNGRIGVFRSIGNQTFSITPMIRGLLGYSEWELGRVNYSGLPTAASIRFQGMEAGFDAMVQLRIGKYMSLAGGYRDRVLIDGLEPHLRTVFGQAAVPLGKVRGTYVAIALHGSNEKAMIRDLDDQQTNFRASISLQVTLIPKERPRSNPFGDDDW